MERLQKVLASSGVASRRKAEELILAGEVQVNGEVVRELGRKVSGTDVILVHGKMIKKEDKVYYLLYKPRGVVSTSSDEKGRKTVVDLIPTSSRIYPIGRLDYDTTGLLLLTNDGEFAQVLMHPKHKIEKVYVAKVRGIVKGDAIHALEKGVEIDGKLTSSARVKLRKVNRDTNTSIVELTIHEGRNHQVKKMLASVGHEVLKLKRERVGFLTLDKLKSGEYRPLSPKEIKQLYAMANYSQDGKKEE